MRQYLSGLEDVSKGTRVRAWEDGHVTGSLEEVQRSWRVSVSDMTQVRRPLLLK